MPYVPDRKTEGYGFSIKGIDKVKKLYDPALVVSVDHGIVGHEKISYAAGLGVPVVVTDHHQKSDTEPSDATAVFHTSALSGSGVSYFFAKEIYEYLRPSNLKNGNLEDAFKTDFLSLASVGLISDMVPLVGPARAIAKHGLAAFTQLVSPGIRALLEEAKIANRPITPYEVGFIIAPRINSFGRIGDATDGLRLLCTTSSSRARELAQKAGETNKRRQELLKSTLQEAEAMVKTNDKIIILHNSLWEEGIIGLVASKITEKFYRPTIVIAGANGFSRASARSIPGFDITEFLRSLKKYLVDVGGHSQAAGFTIETKNINQFLELAQKKAQSLLNEEILTRQTNVDVELPLTLVSEELVSHLESIQPFGIGNPRPTFFSKGVIVSTSFMGRNSEHLKMTIKDEDGSILELVLFNREKKITSLLPEQPISVVYNVDINHWNGRSKVQGITKTFLI